MRLKTQGRITLTLAVLAAVAGVLNFLALNDIHHGEADASLEWSIVRCANLVYLLFFCSSVWTTHRALRSGLD